jgi:hypothetical protein
MWFAVRILRLYGRNVSRIAASLESLVSLYQLDLASRGITLIDPNVRDEVEIQYGYHEEKEIWK